MAERATYLAPPPPSVDPRSGFCSNTNTFHSLRPRIPFPPQDLPLSFPSHAFSLLLASPLLPQQHPAFIDSSTGASLSYAHFLSQVQTLASSLQAHLGLSKGHVAFILSPARLDIPVLYFALLSIGAVVSPGNPVNTPAEISRQFQLTNPSVAFATSSTAAKLPRHVTTVLLDSPNFHSFLHASGGAAFASTTPVEIRQSDPAAILFSSGTTGRVKAASLSHRSFIAMAAGFHALRRSGSPAVMLMAALMFHSLEFIFVMKGVALGETVLLMDRAGFPEMLRVAERHRATEMTTSPPVVAAMARSEEALLFDLGSLECVFCGGAPLAEEVAERFKARFPHVDISQGYGSTEAGGISRMIGREECRRSRSVGRLSENIEAKIMDNVSGGSLSVAKRGELWLRGPAVMTGYIGDAKANASTFSSDGWLKTGDLCFFDCDGFLFIFDRLKELIKYKAYQVPPAELEHLLQSLPEIVDAAVIPYPREEVGQIPMAFVVRKPGSKLKEAEVIDFIAKQVAPYKKIRKVAFINSIPKSAAGKILRRELVNHALCGLTARL